MDDLERLKSTLTERQILEIQFGNVGRVDDNRVGAALARKGITRRHREYEPKTYGDDLSVGYMVITYWLTDLGEDIRNLILGD